MYRIRDVAIVIGFLIINQKERYMQKRTETTQSTQEERKGQIAHHEDLASKFAMQFFGAELLRYLGIRLKIKRIEPTEIIHLEARQMYEDFNFLMENGTWYHMEFESDSISTDDLRRFREYEAVTSRTYKVPVITYVLCSSNVKEPMTRLKEGINTYRIKMIRLKGKNADEVFANLKEKNNSSVTKADLVPVILTPLMEGSLSQMERTKLGMKVLNKEYANVSHEDLKRMQATLYILADKFLTQAEMKELKEVCAMNAFLQMYVDDGIQQARTSDILTLLNELGLIASDLSAKIMGEKNEETLNRWLKLAAKAESVEQFIAEM